ncbi:OmpA family protein [Nonlabens xiamenensis]|uniref:OmpA family protein n=1 Tax=Nonlabens xiamenensis TaxID=2341043 RepID=UPI000F6076A2|nr:OmpA family protein [Nonlabens xiamenensis]
MKSSIKNISAYFILIFGFAGPLLAQVDLMRQSNQEYENLAYDSAQQLYLEIVKNGFESSELFARLGDTYYFNNDYREAKKWYDKLFKYPQQDIAPIYFFRYAQSLKAVKKYDIAEQIMLGLNNQQLAQSNISVEGPAIDFQELIELQAGRYEVKNSAINTNAQDFGATYINNGKQVLFASSKDSSSLIKRRHKWSGRTFLNLYIADADSSGVLNNMRRYDTGLNTQFHESNAVLTKDGQSIYFTRNNFSKGNYGQSAESVNKLKIYRANWDDMEKQWVDIEELSINSDEFSTAHPALNADNSRLYFASDRPGSTMGAQGDKALSDIWYVDIHDDGSLGVPVNLKAINTAGNELFPFVSESQQLYFASNGHPGLGGLDIFVISLDDAGSMDQMPVNLGVPINGPQDDFAFMINEVTSRGFFSSNRSSGKGLDDIYSLKELTPLRCRIYSQVIVSTTATPDNLSEVKVMVLDKENNEVASKLLMDEGQTTFLLNCGETYIIRAETEGMQPEEIVVTTPAQIKSIKIQIELEPSVNDRLNELQIGDDLNDVLSLNPIYFDLDKSEIRYDAELELQKVLAFMKAQPTTVINIKSHTDSRAPDQYNLQLSNRRAQSTMKYLIDRGIAKERLTAEGFGETQLINECSNGVDCSEAQHQLNRRSEFILVRK